MNGQYEVLSPWADVDPVSLKGISPRVTDLTGKTVGLFADIIKPASRPVLEVMERKLKERFPTMKFSWFLSEATGRVTGTKDDARFQEWVKGIDTAVVAIGD